MGVLLATPEGIQGSIQFPLDQPLPLTLIRKITVVRVRESLQEDRKWRA